MSASWLRSALVDAHGQLRRASSALRAMQSRVSELTTTVKSGI